MIPFPSDILATVNKPLDAKILFHTIADRDALPVTLRFKGMIVTVQNAAGMKAEQYHLPTDNLTAWELYTTGEGGGDINPIDLISGDTDNAITAGTDGKLYVQNVEDVITEINETLDNIADNLQTVETQLTEHEGNEDIHVTKTEKETWDNKYNKPTDGIPKNDLSQELQNEIKGSAEHLTDANAHEDLFSDKLDVDGIAKDSDKLGGVDAIDYALKSDVPNSDDFVKTTGNQTITGNTTFFDGDGATLKFSHVIEMKADEIRVLSPSIVKSHTEFEGSVMFSGIAEIGGVCEIVNATGIKMNDLPITDLSNPINPQDATNKQYVDTKVAQVLPGAFTLISKIDGVPANSFQTIWNIPSNIESSNTVMYFYQIWNNGAAIENAMAVGWLAPFYDQLIHDPSGTNSQIYQNLYVYLSPQGIWDRYSFRRNNSANTIEFIHNMDNTLQLRLYRLGP